MSQIDQQAIESLLDEHQVPGHRWIHPSDIEVAHWVRMKCRFGCPEYGKQAGCPPQMPEVEQCRAFFNEYNHALLLHYNKQVDPPEARHGWTGEVNRSLVALERAVFLAGYPKAFVVFIASCGQCQNCGPNPADCTNPSHLRPSPEALAVDVFGTARKAGLPIEVLTAKDQEMNRYGFLLIA